LIDVCSIMILIILFGLAFGPTEAYP